MGKQEELTQVTERTGAMTTTATGADGSGEKEFESTVCFQPGSLSFRLLLLVFACLLNFGSYFCFDQPGVLQAYFENAKDDPEKPGLGLSSTQYNLLYAVYSWCNCVLVLFAGVFLDKVGNRAGLLLFTSMCVLGSSLFALGVTLDVYPLLLIGRTIFGAGNGSLSVCQNKLVAVWFKGKELAMAFGVTLAFSRLGSVLNFLMSPSFCAKHGLKATLWGGAILCVTGLISAIIASSLDIYGSKKLGRQAAQQAASKKVKFADIQHFGIIYWMICACICFFYNAIFPFQADSTHFIEIKYDMSDTLAARAAGCVYYVAMVACPLLGFAIDRIGKRGFLILGSSLATIPVFVMLGFTHVTPWFPVTLLGCTYSVAATSLWPTIALVVPVASVGTAMGVATSLQMLAVGICNLVVGALRGSATKVDTPEHRQDNLDHWRNVMILMLVNVVMCVLCASVLNVLDFRGLRTLNQAPRKPQAELVSSATVTAGSRQDTLDDDERAPLLSNRSKINT